MINREAKKPEDAKFEETALESLKDELNGAYLDDALAQAEKDECLVEVYRRLPGAPDLVSTLEETFPAFLEALEARRKRRTRIEQ